MQKLFLSRHFKMVFTLRAVDRPLDDWDLWCKRSQDLIVSAAVLLLLSPDIAATAMAIKLETRGPVLFRQRRVGLNGRAFELLKNSAP